VGDGILKFPVIRAFKENNSKAKLIWATEKNPSVFFRSLADLGSQYLDEIHEGTSIGSLFKKDKFLPRTHFDTIICTETSILKTLVLKKMKARKFISPAAGFLFSSTRPSESYTDQSGYERFLNLMNLASDKTLLPKLSIPIPKIYLDFAEDRLDKSLVFVGLNPGAGSEDKKWPLDLYVRVAKLLSEHNIVPTFFLGPMETMIKTELERRIPESIFPENDYSRQRAASPLLTVALAQKMAFSLVNDSGGGHLVAAGGKKTITLFNDRRGAKFRSPFCEQVSINGLDFGVRKVRDIPYEPVLLAVNREIQSLIT